MEDYQYSLPLKWSHSQQLRWLVSQKLQNVEVLARHGRWQACFPQGHGLETRERSMRSLLAGLSYSVTSEDRTGRRLSKEIGQVFLLLQNIAFSFHKKDRESWRQNPQASMWWFPSHPWGATITPIVLLCSFASCFLPASWGYKHWKKAGEL